jgi:uncharacterized protein
LVQDDVTFHGHPNVLSSHKKSIEITRDHDLSRRGDCIIGVRSDKGCSHLNEQLRRAIIRDDAKISIEIIVGDLSLKIIGHGSRNLSVQDSSDIVIRKSSFYCPRTLAILCDKAASDIPISVIKQLHHHETKGIFRITVE